MTVPKFVPFRQAHSSTPTAQTTAPLGRGAPWHWSFLHRQRVNRAWIFTGLRFGAGAHDANVFIAFDAADRQTTQATASLHREWKQSLPNDSMTPGLSVVSGRATHALVARKLRIHLAIISESGVLSLGPWPLANGQPVQK
jgi:hypothetical protein